jgi:DNA helicase-2/ATP-dependent DNA helicase PcrA
MAFTSDQLKAINHLKGNLQLIACAGSGKTEVVARRIVNLLRLREKTSVLPRNIVAFTFTERAAAELKDRIVTRATEALGAVTGIAEMYVGTIHGYCLQLLQTYLFEFLKYSVLTEPPTWRSSQGQAKARSSPVARRTCGYFLTR